MTPDEILELVRAGYTKAEISAMETGKESKKEKEAEPDGASEDKDQNDAGSEASTDSVDQRFASITATLDKMVKTMQQMAIRESKQPDGNNNRTPEQVLDDIAKMYN